MKRRQTLALPMAALFFVEMASAQEMPDIGFESVGRGRPLSVSVLDQPSVGPAWLADSVFELNAFFYALQNPELHGYEPDNLPDSVEALPRDLFNSPDFYADQELWTDPRYFRCNSPIATEFQRGILSPVALSDELADSPWGHCDVDYPREAIVSPYEFPGAQAHYEALLEETRERGGPNVYSFRDFPAADWNGQYEDSGVDTGAHHHQNWYWGVHNQIPTLLSLLTPTYQQRMVQEAYHQVRGNALWPSSFCWPDGFMRRYHFAAARGHYVIATPELVQVMTGIAGNFITNVHIGREFKTDGAVPYLSEQVPQWYGETIGFWDEETLVTWTSNIQGWKAHSLFEFSNQMQSIEIYTPIRSASGEFVGVNHESIFYDPEALVEPIRIVRNLHKLHNYSDAEETPFTYAECQQTIFPIEGAAIPISPGDVIEFELPDMYGRPWDEIWRRYFEQGMTRPEPEEDIFSFE